jgi:hypothetical protein
MIHSKKVYLSQLLLLLLLLPLLPLLLYNNLWHLNSKQ